MGRITLFHLSHRKKSYRLYFKNSCNSSTLKRYVFNSIFYFKKQFIMKPQSQKRILFTTICKCSLTFERADDNSFLARSSADSSCSPDNGMSCKSDFHEDLLFVHHKNSKQLAIVLYKLQSKNLERKKKALFEISIVSIILYI